MANDDFKIKPIGTPENMPDRPEGEEVQKDETPPVEFQIGQEMVKFAESSPVVEIGRTEKRGKGKKALEEALFCGNIYTKAQILKDGSASPTEKFRFVSKMQLIPEYDHWSPFVKEVLKEMKTLSDLHIKAREDGQKKAYGILLQRAVQRGFNGITSYEDLGANINANRENRSIPVFTETITDSIYTKEISKSGLNFAYHLSYATDKEEILSRLNQMTKGANAIKKIEKIPEIKNLLTDINLLRSPDFEKVISKVYLLPDKFVDKIKDIQEVRCLLTDVNLLRSTDFVKVISKLIKTTKDTDIFEKAKKIPEIGKLFSDIEFLRSPDLEKVISKLSQLPKEFIEKIKDISEIRTTLTDVNLLRSQNFEKTTSRLNQLSKDVIDKIKDVPEIRKLLQSQRFINSSNFENVISKLNQMPKVLIDEIKNIPEIRGLLANQHLLKSPDFEKIIFALYQLNKNIPSIKALVNDQRFIKSPDFEKIISRLYLMPKEATDKIVNLNEIKSLLSENKLDFNFDNFSNILELMRGVTLRTPDELKKSRPQLEQIITQCRAKSLMTGFFLLQASWYDQSTDNNGLFGLFSEGVGYLGNKLVGEKGTNGEHSDIAEAIRGGFNYVGIGQKNSYQMKAYFEECAQRAAELKPLNIEKFQEDFKYIQGEFSEKYGIKYDLNAFKKVLEIVDSGKAQNKDGSLTEEYKNALLKAINMDIYNPNDDTMRTFMNGLGEASLMVMTLGIAAEAKGGQVLTQTSMGLFGKLGSSIASKQVNSSLLKGALRLAGKGVSLLGPAIPEGAKMYAYTLTTGTSANIANRVIKNDWEKFLPVQSQVMNASTGSFTFGAFAGVSGATVTPKVMNYVSKTSSKVTNALADKFTKGAISANEVYATILEKTVPTKLAEVAAFCTDVAGFTAFETASTIINNLDTLPDNYTTEDITKLLWKEFKGQGYNLGQIKAVSHSIMWMKGSKGARTASVKYLKENTPVLNGISVEQKGKGFNLILADGRKIECKNANEMISSLHLIVRGEIAFDKKFDDVVTEQQNMLKLIKTQREQQAKQEKVTPKPEGNVDIPQLNKEELIKKLAETTSIGNDYYLLNDFSKMSTEQLQFALELTQTKNSDGELRFSPCEIYNILRYITTKEHFINLLELAKIKNSDGEYRFNGHSIADWARLSKQEWDNIHLLEKIKKANGEEAYYDHEKLELKDLSPSQIERLSELQVLIYSNYYPVEIQKELVQLPENQYQKIFKLGKLKSANGEPRFSGEDVLKFVQNLTDAQINTLISNATTESKPMSTEKASFDIKLQKYIDRIKAERPNLNKDMIEICAQRLARMEQTGSPYQTGPIDDFELALFKSFMSTEAGYKDMQANGDKILADKHKIMPVQTRLVSDLEFKILRRQYDEGGNMSAEWKRQFFEMFKTAEPLTEEQVVYRAICIRNEFCGPAGNLGNNAFIEGLREGTIITSEGWTTSTAPKFDYAVQRFSPLLRDGKGYIMKITLPKGTKGIDYRGIKKPNGNLLLGGKQSEFLLPPNSKIKINKIDAINQILECEYILPTSENFDYSPATDNKPRMQLKNLGAVTKEKGKMKINNEDIDVKIITVTYPNRVIKITEKDAEYGYLFVNSTDTIRGEDGSVTTITRENNIIRKVITDKSGKSIFDSTIVTDNSGTIVLRENNLIK